LQGVWSWLLVLEIVMIPFSGFVLCICANKNLCGHIMLHDPPLLRPKYGLSAMYSLGLRYRRGPIRRRQMGRAGCSSFAEFYSFEARAFAASLDGLLGPLSWSTGSSRVRLLRDLVSSDGTPALAA
jgi:hypothetical protein